MSFTIWKMCIICWQNVEKSTCWFFSIRIKDLIISARWNWSVNVIRSNSGSVLEPDSDPERHGRSFSIAVRTLGWTTIGSGGNDVKFKEVTLERFSLGESVSLVSPLSSIELLKFFIINYFEKANKMKTNKKSAVLYSIVVNIEHNLQFCAHQWNLFVRIFWRKTKFLWPDY